MLVSGGPAGAEAPASPLGHGGETQRLRRRLPYWAEWHHPDPPPSQVYGPVRKTRPPVPPEFQPCARLTSFASRLHSFWKRASICAKLSNLTVVTLPL